MKIRKAIVPAAGLGTRFLPATKAQPKEMLTIVDKPAIQYIIEEAIASGIEDVIIVTGKHKRAIEDHFDRSLELEIYLEEQQQYDHLRTVRNTSNLIDIHYIRQKQPLGLGHAIYCARKFIGDEPFAVLLGDDLVRSEVPLLKQMMDCYEQSQTSILAVQEVKWEDVSKYGIVKVEQSLNGPQQVIDVVEKPAVINAPSNLGIIGRYIIEPGIFEHLAKINSNSKGEIELTDALRSYNLEKQMIAYPFHGKRYDTGDKFGYIKASIELAIEHEELNDSLSQYILELAEQIKNGAKT